MAFIIDRYNRFDKFDKEHSKYVFEINEQQYAIKEVILFWGQPQLAVDIQHDQNPETYHLYESYEEAMEFVQRMKKINRI